MAADHSPHCQKTGRLRRQNATGAVLLACALLLSGAGSVAAQPDSDPLAGNAGSDGASLARDADLLSEPHKKRPFRLGS